MLWVSDTMRPVIIIDHKGIEVVGETETSVLVDIKAGEVWHDLVLWALDRDLGGIENLSLIPGKCGAAPIQNIGAYGVELSDVLISVHCIDRTTLEEVTIKASDCELGYRNSIFKNDWKDRYVIESILIRLDKKEAQKINTSYGAIAEVLLSKGIDNPGIKDVSDAVIAIRSSKLPDPHLLPNAGSFFKNPIVSKEVHASLEKRFGSIPSYSISQLDCKIPAGWLIDRCGWKGIMIGNVGVHSRQALVLVNHGTDNGEKILNLSHQIQKAVLIKYGISLVPEVNVIT